jgi:hypothetical protein
MSRVVDVDDAAVIVSLAARLGAFDADSDARTIWHGVSHWLSRRFDAIVADVAGQEVHGDGLPHLQQGN